MAIAQLQLPSYAAIDSSADFTPLAKLGQVYQQQQQDAATKQTLASLGQNPNGRIDPTPLLQSGIPTLATLGVNIAQRNQDLDRQSSQDTRQASRDAVDDKFRTASLGLQQQAAKRADEDKFSIQKVENPDGTTAFVRINQRTGESNTITPSGAQPAAPSNPFASTNGKMNADQSKSATMVDRMAQAHDVISNNENINDGLGGFLGGVAAGSPQIRDTNTFNKMASPERQKTIQAQRNFVNALLRVESGAAISESEFNNAQRQYFPQPGDDASTIAQKRENRLTAMRGMSREAGVGYKPPASILPTKPTTDASQPNVTSSGVKWSIQ